MPTITLTTDFGLKDYYVAAIKGSIISQVADAQIIDVSHLVPPHDIVQAAYHVKHAYKSFPAGTIHIISVNNYAMKESSFLITKHYEQYFITPNNGLLSLIFEELPIHIYQIPFASEDRFIVKNIYATLVRHISEGGSLDEIGQSASEVEQRITLKPVISTSQIRGSIIHVDHYENAIVNIHRTLFEQVGHGRQFQLFFKRHDPIGQLSEYYHDVEVGEVLCLFNSAGYLEIAVNMGQAATLLGLNVDDTVQIDFKNT